VFTWLSVLARALFGETFCVFVLQVCALVAGPCSTPTCQPPRDHDSDVDDVASLVSGTDEEVSELSDDTCNCDSVGHTAPDCDAGINAEASSLFAEHLAWTWRGVRSLTSVSGCVAAQVAVGVCAKFGEAARQDGEASHCGCPAAQVMVL
jgi:hypothetical protein